MDTWDKTFVARVGDADVRVVLTGAGRFAAQRAMDHAFSEKPDVCIASGLAGALKADYLPGQVLVARSVANLAGTRVVFGHTELISLAIKSGAKVAAKLFASERAIGTAKEKQQLGASGDAVDMESLYVLVAAGQRSVPAVAIRAISDAVDADLPLDFDRVFDEQGNVSIAKVLGQVVLKPHRIAGLLRLANDSERAAGELAAFLDKYIQTLSSQPLDENAKAEALVAN